MRLPRLSSLFHLFSVFRDRYFLSEPLKQYQEFFARKNAGRDSASPQLVVALQCVEDTAFFGMIGTIITRLRSTASVRADLYILRSLRKDASISPRRFFWSVVGSNFLSDNAWKRMYFSYCDRVAYRSAAWMPPWTEVRLLWKAIRLWHHLNSMDKLSALEVRGIKIGDLVIDSYLRFKASHMIKLGDPYLAVIVRQALRDIEKAFNYFGTIKPDLYLTSYTTYIQHGVPARVAAACGTRVLAFGNFQEFAKPITSEDPHQTRHGAGYARIFSGFPNQSEKIARSDRELSARLAGKIDTSTAYMKTSAYQSTKNDLPAVQGSLVIFLHDFYDSVHLYPSILFHDFWSWIGFTIDTMHRYDIPFFIKPHPNQTLASDEAFQDLCRTYPDLRILPSDVNNKQLAEAGIAGAVSVFGTVISEMAYLGVPSISCGDNPHSSFPFCHVASTQAEYEALLKNFRSLQTDRIAMKEQACAFYYMHNLNLSDEALDLRDRSIKLRCDIWFGPPRDVKDELADFEDFFVADSLGRFCRDLISSILNDHARSCKSPPHSVTSS